MADPHIPEGWHLGMTSASRESRGDPGTISTGKDDHGGVSYGTYQLSSKEGTLNEYLHQSAYKKDFDGLRPTTPAFDAKWKELASNDPGFGQDQFDYIKRTHYDTQVEALKSEGIDLSSRGPAVQDALWSTAVQFGGNTKVFENGLHEKFGKNLKLDGLSDKDIVAAVQDYKIAHNETLFKSSPRELSGLKHRAEEEKADLLNLADGKLPDHAHKQSAPSHAAVLKEHSKGADVIALQSELAALGYTDSHGHALRADGRFGRDTVHAVENYQRNNGLTVDGVAGPATRSMLQEQVHQLENSRGPYAEPAQAVTKDSSTHDMFEAICSAAERGDTKGMLAVGKCYEQSPEGQSYLAMGAQLNQQQAQIQAQNQTINQQAAQITAQGPVAQQAAPMSR
ncbi:peptidoglycan-binding domain-containing protein [Rhodanobacter sp. BL-MT-08]